MIQVDIGNSCRLDWTIDVLGLLICNSFYWSLDKDSGKDICIFISYLGLFYSYGTETVMSIGILQSHGTRIKDGWV